LSAATNLFILLEISKKNHKKNTVGHKLLRYFYHMKPNVFNPASLLGKWTIVFISIGLGISLSYISLLVFGYSPTDWAAIFKNPSPRDGLALGWANLAQQLGIFGFSWFLLHQQFSQKPVTGPSNSSSWMGILLGMLWLIISYGFIEFSSALNLQLLSFFPEFKQWSHEKEMMTLRVQTALMDNTDVWGITQVIFLVAIVPGILEELFFRSIIFRWQLERFSPGVAIVLNGFIFSLIHFQFEGFLARWILGMMLAHLYYHTQNIFASIAMHIFNNLLGVILYIFVYTEMSFSADHWIHLSPVIFTSTLFFVVGWVSIVYLWRPKGLST